MKKATQTSTNPFSNSDSNKRYYTFDYFCRKHFGGKCAKIPLDGGLGCPNKDGSKGRGGCIYCLNNSSGAANGLSIEEQYKNGIERISGKWSPVGYIPYLQAGTNTYGNISVLENLFSRASSLENAVMLSIATRADCLDSNVIRLIENTAEKIPLTVELGLQTIHDRTAVLINRGHTYKEFLNGYKLLREVPGVLTCIHIINFLPKESEQMMLETAEECAVLRPDMVKIHLLHVLKGTRLFDMYTNGEYIPPSKEEYVSLTAKQIEYFHSDTVIARLTGDGLGEYLAAPEWSRKKVCVINDIDKFMHMNSLYQGRLFKE